MQRPFGGAWWLPGRHAETLWPAVARRVRIRPRTEWFEAADGERVQLDWVGEGAGKEGGKEGGPIVLVLPGLQGDLESSYVAGVLRACERRGWRGVLLHYRGRSSSSRLKTAYHCGMSCDVHEVAHELRRREPATSVGVVGYSVGANIVMKWLGECGHAGVELPIAGAAGVSLPFHLGEVSGHVGKGFSRFYQWYLVRSLRQDLMSRMAAMDMGLGLTPRDVRRLRTFFAFDTHVTAPLHGFDGAEDLYHRTRSIAWLAHIRVPSLIVNAKNDPLVPSRLIPDVSEVSEQVTLEVTDRGGHLGFVGGRWPWRPRYWVEERVLDFLAERFASAGARSASDLGAAQAVGAR